MAEKFQSNAMVGGLDKNVVLLDDEKQEEKTEEDSQYIDWAKIKQKEDEE